MHSAQLPQCNVMFRLAYKPFRLIANRRFMSLSRCQLPNGGQFHRQSEAKVVSCATTPATEAIKGASKKTPIATTYDIVLDSTVLFPEGGGQPADKGTIRAGNTLANVLNVQRNGEEIVHTVDVPLPVGAEVTVEVDWTYRLDVMQQHSAQHLISAVWKQCFHVPTVSWSMAVYPEHSFIDLDISNITPFNPATLPILPDSVAPEVSRWVQQYEDGIAQGRTPVEMASELVPVIVNTLIRANVPVQIHVWPDVATAEADAAYQAARAAGRAKAFPAALQGAARCVEIVGLEYNTCCGTHVSALSELQAVAVVKYEKAKSAYRTHFNAGGRLVASYQTMYSQQQALVQLFGVPAPSVVAAAEKTHAMARARAKEVVELQTRLMEIIAAQLAQREDRLVAHVESAAELSVLSALGSAFTAIAPTRVLIAAAPTENSAEGTFLVIGPAALVKAAGQAYAAAVGGRGGGRPGVFQGKATQLNMHEAAVAAATEAIANL